MLFLCTLLFEQLLNSFLRFNKNKTDSKIIWFLCVILDLIVEKIRNQRLLFNILIINNNVPILDFQTIFILYYSRFCKITHTQRQAKTFCWDFITRFFTMFTKGSTVSNKMIKNLIALYHLVILKTLKHIIQQLNLRYTQVKVIIFL